MSYEINWKIEKRVIYYHASGNYTVLEAKSANKELRQFVAEGENPVHAILDVRDLEKFPINIRLFEAEYPFGDTTGTVVLVGGNALMKYLANILVKLASTNLYHVPTLDEAIQYLQEKDPTLHFDD